MYFPGNLLLGKRRLVFDKEKKGHREVHPDPKGKWKHWEGNEEGLRNLDYRVT